MKVLVVNSGSSSLKWRVIDTEAGAIREGKAERLEGKDAYGRALEPAVEAARELGVEAVGHRVVHGGPHFDAACVLDDEIVESIESCVPLAPLHNPANLAGIRAARAALGDLPQVAVFDTAFHATLPRRARTYALPRELSEERGFRRYGFHGISHAYVARAAAEHLGTPIDQLRLVTCHLGNGASVAAVEYGRSIETSMGMTPLEGLVMGTRSGDVDPAIVLSLVREGRSAEEVERLLNRESGLAGLSGLGNDLRDIEQAAAEGHDGARLSIAVFAHRVRKYIGAYAAVMGGVDAIVLTGGIGENSIPMRRRILQRFEFLGLVLDEDEGAGASTSKERPVIELHARHARTRALVVSTDEEQMIATETARLLELPELRSPKSIPIAVSARHAHLDRATLDALFGAGYELTPRAPLSQPGQFASEETVSLIGPRARIDGVRILGPLREKTQVEISRTDEFTLGVDAPVRPSGQIEGSAPITLEGPAGTVHLEEGLICALRHIHMHPDDAAEFGVENDDVVEVTIEGGPRDLTFGDVLVRVSEKHQLEMHIDTDEANAAEITPDATGALVYTPAPDAVSAGLVGRR